MPAGRPTKYDSKLCAVAKNLMLLGKTRDEIADILGVTSSTLYKWQAEHEEFSEALNEGGVVADADVAASLYQKAKGYYKDGQYIPGDTPSMIFWLKNRQSKLWRDKREIEMPQNPDQEKTIEELEQEILDLTTKINGNPETRQRETGTTTEGTEQSEEVQPD